MKRIMLYHFCISLSLLVVLFLSCCRQLLAQTIPEKQALSLIAKNSSLLNLSANDINNARIAAAYLDKTSNTQFIYLQQTWQGIPVYNSIQVIALKNDKVISVKGGRIAKMEGKTGPQSRMAQAVVMQSVAAAAKELNIRPPVSVTVLSTDSKNQQVEMNSSGISKENITSDLLWVPTDDGRVTLAWQVKILPVNSNAYWLVRVNARDQSILGKDNLTVSCNWENFPDKRDPFSGTKNRFRGNEVQDYKINIQKKDLNGNGFTKPETINSGNYRVIPFPAESMVSAGGTPVLITDPWLNAGASNPAVSLGWHNDGSTDYAYTRGNNVWAKEDHAGNDGNSGASAMSTTASPHLKFDFAFDAGEKPDTGNNQNFSITQLFYWNNIMHDITYQYGFDEVAGNFQKSNMGRGGAENDFVYADGQDGSTTNNAYFTAPSDGYSPRMQMYLWNPQPHHVLTVNLPTSLAGFKMSVEGALSSNNLLKDTGPITDDVVLYHDDDAGSTHLACGDAANASALNGKIALIDRGDCWFTEKIKNAQNAGAVAVIIVNNVAGDTLFAMTGPDNSITIPAVMIFQNDGNSLKAALELNKTVNVTLRTSFEKLDGDLDNGIMAHEYTHGISSRFTGGPTSATCLTNKEQAGEGWSDYFALMFTTDWATASISDGEKPRLLGAYVYDPNGTGIRTYPYSTDMTLNPWNYADVERIAGGEVHTIGEIWAATLWDMTWNIIHIAGINENLYYAGGTGGNSVALKLVMMGLKLQPCSPGYLDARDAILEADTILYNGKYSCAIWNAFARRGMGADAQQGSSNNTKDQVAGFSIPVGVIIKKSVDKSEATQNETLTYIFTVCSQCVAVSNYTIADTLARNVTYMSGGTYHASSRTVTFNIPNLSAEETQSYSFEVSINNGAYFIPDTLLKETVPENEVPATLPATNDVTGIGWTANTDNQSAPYSLKSDEPAMASEQVLTSLHAYMISGYTQLSFWQKFNTEASFDGGVVELSIDNGYTWVDAGPYMRKNGYNSNINANTNLNNKRAYSGCSNGFVQTIINLSAFENRSVRFRFRFVTDNFVSGDGWYIDDILINKMPAVYNFARLFDQWGNLQSSSDTVTFITAEALPLVWGDFTAAKEEKTALLKWTTFQEINTSQFFVERSKDGIHFYTSGILNASGNTNSVTAYNYRDTAPLVGANFYRVRQTDNDGKFIYSEVRALSFDFGKGTIIISPNPARDHIHIMVAGNMETLEAILLNAFGQRILHFTIKGAYNSLPLPALATGVYYLKVTGAGISSVRKIVIEK